MLPSSPCLLPFPSPSLSIFSPSLPPPPFLIYKTRAYLLYSCHPQTECLSHLSQLHTMSQLSHALLHKRLPTATPTLPSYCSLTAYLLQSTCCHSLLHPHDLTSLSKLYTTPPHPFNSCKKFASPSQPLFKNLLLVLLQLNNQPLRTHCAKTATVLPLKSQRKDILSLTYRTCLLLHPLIFHASAKKNWSRK